MDENPKCPECGGDCAPECGRHPMGCMYGGFSEGYWIAIDGCPLDHGGDALEALLARDEP